MVVRIQRLLSLALFICAAVALAGCNTVRETVREMRTVEIAPDPPSNASLPLKLTPQFSSQEKDDARLPVSAEQIDSVGPDEDTHHGQAALDQIRTSQSANDFAQEVIGSDDPCTQSLAQTERCKQTIRATPHRTGGVMSDPASTIGAFSPSSQQVESFDPGRTVDEIGRGRTVSQAAQSLGSSFLAAPKPPEEPELDTVGADLEGAIVMAPGTYYPGGPK